MLSALVLVLEPTIGGAAKQHHKNIYNGACTLAHLCASTRCYSQRSVARSLIRTIGENKSSGPTFEMRGGPSDSYYVTLVGRTL